MYSENLNTTAEHAVLRVGRTAVRKPLEFCTKTPPILILRMRLSVLEFDFRRLALAVSCRYTRHCGPIIRRCPIKSGVW